MSETGVVDIRGKDYNTVAKRVKDFLSDDIGRIRTEVLFSDESRVLVRAEIRSNFDSEIIIASAHAEEKRVSQESWDAMDYKTQKKNQVNYTNPLENAETSSVGRALAFLGYLGSDIATEEDIARAHDKAREEALGAPDPELIKALEDAAGRGLERLQTAWKLLTEEQRKQVGVARKDALKVLANGS